MEDLISAFPCSTQEGTQVLPTHSKWVPGRKIIAGSGCTYFRTVLWSLAPLLWVFSTIELACIYSKQMEVQSSLGNVHWSWNWPKRLWACSFVCHTNWMLSTTMSLSITQTFLVVNGLRVHREVKTNAITEAYLTFSGSSLMAEFKDTGKVCRVAAPGITQRTSKSSQKAGKFPQCKCSLPFSTTFTTLDGLT